MTLPPIPQNAPYELSVFWKAWFRAPLRVAAVAPSSQGLARLVTAGISAESAPVIELGAGTGSFTRALVARGVPEDRLTLVEVDPAFGTILRHRFPRAAVVATNATRLKHLPPLSDEKAGAVVSGLPLLSMPSRQIMAILEGAFLNLREGGSFYQFTYGIRCPVHPRILDRLGLKATRVGGIFANLPPAWVYRIARRPHRAAV